MESKRLKRCTTSNDAGKEPEPLQKGERKFDSKVKSKKKIRKKKSEKKQIQEETKQKQKKQLITHNKELTKEEKETSLLYNDAADWISSISVRGFDPSLALDDIKSALTNHFGPCGKISRVYVGRANGYAHLDMKPEGAEKALMLHGSLFGGMSLEVRMASDTDEYDPHFVKKRNLYYFHATGGGRYWNPELMIPGYERGRIKNTT